MSDQTPSLSLSPAEPLAQNSNAGTDSISIYYWPDSNPERPWTVVISIFPEDGSEFNSEYVTCSTKSEARMKLAEWLMDNSEIAKIVK